MPTEGTATRHPRAGDVAGRDVPTCLPDERMGAVKERVAASGWDVCVVVNAERIVFGLLREEQLRAAGEERAEAVMRPGPGTFRPHIPIIEMAAFMAQHDLGGALITTSDGRLVGMLRRDDAAEEAMRAHVGRGRAERDR